MDINKELEKELGNVKFSKLSRVSTDARRYFRN